MLRYQVRGENLEITQPIREYVENKVYEQAGPAALRAE